MAISEIISYVVLCIAFLVMIIGGGMALAAKDDKAEDTIIIGSLIVIWGFIGLVISMFLIP